MPFDTPATENAERHVTKLTKRYLMKPFWVLLVPFLFPSALAAEPSLAETVQYIEAKLSSSMPELRISFRLNGEYVAYRYSLKQGDHNTSVTYNLEYTFRLDALSTTVTTSGGSVEISCARGACIRHENNKIFWAEDIGSKRERESSYIGSLSFSVNSDDVERTQKALTHAIKLSGGKDELF